MAYADLEIGLHRQGAQSYRIELRFSRPDADADVWLVRGGPRVAYLAFDRLRALTLDDAAYGQLLSDSLFEDEEIRSGFAQALSTAQSLDVPLRVRLFIGPSAPELHSLRWETLRLPQNGAPLLTGEGLLFSRYLSSLDWRPVGLLPRADLRALVMVANGTNLHDYQPGGRALAAIDVAGELERAASGLGDIPVTPLASNGSATLNALMAHLRAGHNILYLVCHGALIRGEPYLWLEDEQGAAAVVSGAELVTRLRELWHRPRLVVLASCQSAGSGDEARSADEGALAALGPRLAEAGVPAVLAMQGNVTMETVKRFMPVFFHELQTDGQIDRAAAVARGAVRDRHDWWAPVLFMRLKSGRIWYAPGFADERHGLEKWPALKSSIRQGICTPILGPGLTDSLVGSRREIAQRWAETYAFPMAPFDREDLPRVAQYMAVNQSYTFLRAELGQYLIDEVQERYKEHLPAELEGASLDELITAVGKWRWERDPAEPHRVLAQLDLPVYITTAPSNLLAEALTAAGRQPQVEIFPWNDDLQYLPPAYKRDPSFAPDPQHPLVYHLFGRLDVPRSLVLTEDDYFEFLIGVTKNKDLIPEVVRWRLVDTALLFLGFRMDDWNFRVLYRSIMSQEGRRRRREYAHVAVQIDPEEGRILRPEPARRYLESYFQDAEISIYWGSVEDFVQELRRTITGDAQ